MPLKPLPYREVRRKLLSAGFEEVGQSGSHVKFARAVDGGTRTAIVPKGREVATGTIRSAIRQAGLSDEEWNRL
jgi:predicted RNA binding protein YcfA (HicA-like mRNA interferase family)